MQIFKLKLSPAIRYALLFVAFSPTEVCFSQGNPSKKEQIEILNYRVDSLVQIAQKGTISLSSKELVINEKELIIINLSAEISDLKKNIEQINSKLESLTIQLDEKNKESNFYRATIQIKSDSLVLLSEQLDGKKKEFNFYRATIQIKSDSLVLLSEQLEKKNTSNTSLYPQEISYDGKPELEYRSNNEIIALDSYNETDNEGKYIRMKFNNQEEILKLQVNNSSKIKRVYTNSSYIVTFRDVVLGDCAGEGRQSVTGNALIESTASKINVSFNGEDSLYSSKKCQEIGND